MISRRIISTATHLPRPITSSLLHSTRVYSTTQNQPGTLNSQTISNISRKESELTSDPQPIPSGPTATAQSHANEKITSQILHDITEAEKGITGADGPVRHGPAAMAQRRLGRAIDAAQNDGVRPVGGNGVDTVGGAGANFTGEAEERDVDYVPEVGVITKPTDSSIPTPGGVVAEATSSPSQINSASSTSQSNNPVMDSTTISAIHASEKNLTGGTPLASDVASTIPADPLIGGFNNNLNNEGPISGGPAAAAQSHAGEPIDRRVLHDITEGEKRITGLDGPVKGGPTATAQGFVGRARNQN